MARKIAALLALLSVACCTYGQQPVRIGLINVTSGPFGDLGTQLDNGVRTYVHQYGDTVAGRRIEIIRRDTGGIAPEVAKRFAQELIVRDKVDILAGFLDTPNALAAADVSAEARKLMVVMNASASVLTTRSPYLTRVSIVNAQAMEPFGIWAVRNGLRQTFSVIVDHAGGNDAEAAFVRAFKEAGGTVAGTIRYPVATLDFAVYAARAVDSRTPSIFCFVPGSGQSSAFFEALVEHGLDLKKTRLLAGGAPPSEATLRRTREGALGIVSASHYDYKRDSPANREFVRLHNELFKRNPDQSSLGGYDGMHLIYQALRKTGGKADGESLIAAAKGLSWESPRGPMSIDPQTRDVIQTIYIYEVRKVGDEIVNVAIDRFENVKDPEKARLKQP